MSYMFSSAESFNSDISGWDVSKVQQMYSMFERAVAFRQDITGWSFDDSDGAWYSSERMFSGALAFFGSYTNCGYDDSDTSVCTGTYEASDGMYDGPAGAWQRNTCDASAAPRNGDVGNCTAFLERGGTCQPRCDSGYAVTGPSACEAGVLTSGFCLDTSGPACDASAAPENGGVGDCTATLVSGTICQPTCDAEFTVTGFSYCDGGEYTSATCAGKPCVSIPAPANGTRGDCGDSLESGATCQPACNGGYEISGSYSCVSGTLTSVTCSPKPPCESDFRVVRNACVACQAGKYRPAGDDPTGGDTTCSFPSPPPPPPPPPARPSPPPSAPSPPPRLVFGDYDSSARRLGASRAARALALFAACAAVALA